MIGLETVAKDKEDAKVAMREAIECFCIAAEKFGNGIVQELKDFYNTMGVRS